MNYAALSLEQSPPLSVPLRYYLTAPVFAMGAALILVWEGPGALAGRWTPSLLASTHLLTLGFLAMVTFGSVQQILPVLMDSPVPRPRLVGAVVHGLLAVGTVLLGAGLFLGVPALFQGAVALLGAGVGLFVAVAAWCLARARSAHATVTATALSVAALAVAAALGLHLAAGYGWGEVGLARHLTDLHLGWGLAGWVGLLVIGVAYQVIPMFHVTPDYPRPVTRWLAALLFLALGLWSFALGAGASPLALPAGAATALALAAFALATLYIAWRRRRRLSDVTLNYWRLAAGSLLAAVLLWFLVRAGLGVPEVLPGVLFVVGFAMSAVSGMLHKIVPFLVWLHLNNRLQAAGTWQGGIPNMKQIIPESRARRQFRLQGAALALAVGAVLWPGIFTRAAGLALFLAAGVLWWNLLDAARLYGRLTAPVAEGA